MYHNVDKDRSMRKVSILFIGGVREEDGNNRSVGAREPSKES
jgi:hypothetical protein